MLSFALFRNKAKRGVEFLLNSQCLEISAESRERTALEVGSLCLPYYMQDTAWFTNTY